MEGGIYLRGTNFEKKCQSLFSLPKAQNYEVNDLDIRVLVGGWSEGKAFPLKMASILFRLIVWKKQNIIIRKDLRGITMLGEGADKEIKIGSDNKVASDNTFKGALINFEPHIYGLENAVSLFFPSMRYEVIQRYRAETIAKIGIEAYRLANEENIQFKPIPPKIAMPLLEKMSLEHEPDMYEKWASLLLTAAVKPSPLHLQYADILANLDNRSANFLKEVYDQQEGTTTEELYNYFREQSTFDEHLTMTIRETRMSIPGTKYKPMVTEPGKEFSFPMVVTGTEKNVMVLNKKNPSEAREERFTLLTNEEKNFLSALKRLGIIEYQQLNLKDEKTEDGNIELLERYGVLLTRFGYSFVDCLEKRR